MVRKQCKYSDRTIDELKDRFYAASKAVMIRRGKLDHPMAKVEFNYELEVRRKSNLEKFFMRTKE